MKKHLRHLRLLWGLPVVLLLLGTGGLRGQAAPLAATALPEGRTYDQAHSTGYIDWSGSPTYVSFYHRSSTITSPNEGSLSCGTGCTEPVTKIPALSSVSGTILSHVTYFEDMAANEYQCTGVGTVVVTACGQSFSQNLAKSSAASVPGFNSFIVSVPAGCREWQVSASGGHVHFRSVDAEYVTPTATPTNTSTSEPTTTLTATNTTTATSTPTLTSTATTTAEPTTTSTPEPTATIEPPATPWVVTVPVVIVMQSQEVKVEGASGGGSSTLSDVAVTATPYLGNAYLANAGGAACRYALRTFVYVDGNDDKLMSPNEGAEDLEVVYMNASYTRLGIRWTDEGQAVFCISPTLAGQLLYVELPYLHQTQTVTIPKSLDEDVEVWFRLEPPTLPIYLP